MPTPGKCRELHVLAASVKHTPGAVELLLRTEDGAKVFVFPAALAEAVGEGLAGKPEIPEEPRTRKHEYHSSDREEKYRAAVADWRSGKYPTLTVAAEKHSLQYGTLCAWRSRERYRQLGAATGPVTKPNGKIL